MKILLVDDNRDLTEVMGLLMRNLLGFETKGVQTCVEALEALHSFRPDIVLLDVILAGACGLALGRKIRARSSIPLVAFTGYCGKDVQAMATISGFDAFLVKPSSIMEIADTVTGLTIGASTS